MPELVWDKVGDRVYESGLDKGVLYLSDGTAVPWNGLISIIESFDKSNNPVYYDGMKISDLVTLGDFSATMKAITYPEEFVELEGQTWLRQGSFVGDQKPQTFGLCYRTKIGNDLDGEDAGYKIHIIYNVTALPSNKTYSSRSINPNLIEFEWNIVAIPEECPGIRPTAHLVLDSRDFDPWLLEDVEEKLYGSTFSAASLIPMCELITYIKDWCRIHITDNGDGTWTASAVRDELIYFFTDREEKFTINQANVMYLDSGTYDTYLNKDTYIITDTCDVTEVPTIKFTDNGDGTWTATTAHDNLFLVNPDSWFQISNANAEFIGVDMYRVSNTE